MSMCCNDNGDNYINDDDEEKDDNDDDVWLLIPLFRVIQVPRVNQGHEVPKDGKWVTFIDFYVTHQLNAYM